MKCAITSKQPEYTKFILLSAKHFLFFRTWLTLSDGEETKKKKKQAPHKIKVVETKTLFFSFLFVFFSWGFVSVDTFVLNMKDKVQKK